MNTLDLSTSSEPDIMSPLEYRKIWKTACRCAIARFAYFERLAGIRGPVSAS